MSRDKERYRENIADRQEQIREQKAEAERKEHAEERELPPDEPVAAADMIPDERPSDPPAPGLRSGDQR
jgi:hypothetical protein